MSDGSATTFPHSRPRNRPPTAPSPHTSPSDMASRPSHTPPRSPIPQPPTSIANPHTCPSPTTSTPAQSPASAGHSHRSRPCARAFGGNPQHVLQRLIATQPGAKARRAMQLGVQQRQQHLALAKKCLPVQPAVPKALMQPLNVLQRMRHRVQMPRPRRRQRCPPRSSCTRESSAASHSY